MGHRQIRSEIKAAVSDPTFKRVVKIWDTRALVGRHDSCERGFYVAVSVRRRSDLLPGRKKSPSPSSFLDFFPFDFGPDFGFRTSEFPLKGAPSRGPSRHPRAGSILRRKCPRRPGHLHRFAAKPLAGLELERHPQLQQHKPEPGSLGVRRY